MLSSPGSHRGVRVPLAFVVLSIVSTSCSVVYEPQAIQRGDFLLRQIRDDDGTVRTYTVSTDRVTSGVSLERKVLSDSWASLGVRVGELSPEVAKGRDVEPYSGLLVRSVSRSSPAGRAGVLQGDVLKTLDGHTLTDPEEFERLMWRLPQGKPLAITLVRGPDKERQLAVEPEFHDVQRTWQKTVPLRTIEASGGKPYAGVSFASIPSHLYSEIFGEDRRGIMLTTVQTGSPAYQAGLRRGDIVEQIDGRPAPDAEELPRLIAERGREGRSVQFTVSRDSGRLFETEVELEDYTRGAQVTVPFVFGSRSRHDSSRWSVGPLGAVASYSNQYVESDTREPQSRGAVSMLLGLIRFSWSPEVNRTRLLWLISFDS